MSKIFTVKSFVIEKILDYIDLSSSKELTITRNPFGFENKIKENEGYKGVYNRNETIDEAGKIILDERGVMSDEDFIARVIKLLRKKLDIEVSPRNIVHIPMSDYQFQIYELARHDERETEGKGKSDAAKIDIEGLFEKPKATYKIFSRLFCNFVMPDPPGRPTPGALRAEKNIMQGMDLLKQRQEDRENAVKENIELYKQSLPADFNDNPENVELLKAQIAKYNKQFLVIFLYFLLKKLISLNKFIKNSFFS